QLTHELRHRRQGDPPILTESILNLRDLLRVKQSTQRRNKVVVLQRLDNLEVIHGRQINSQLKIANLHNPLRIINVSLLRPAILRRLNSLNLSHSSGDLS